MPYGIYQQIKDFFKRKRLDLGQKSLVTSHNIEELLLSPYQQLQSLLNIDRFYGILYDSDKAQIQFLLVMEHGRRAKKQSPWINRPYQGHTLLPDYIIEERQQLVFVSNLEGFLSEKHLRYWPDNSLPLSWLGIPMIAEGRIIGAIIAEKQRKSRAFKKKIEIISAIVSVTATKVDQALFDERQERQIRSLKVLNEVGQTLTSKIRLNEQEILEL